MRDIVGLYLNPPDKALVLWVDEKSQVQALERTQPVLPLGLGLSFGLPPPIPFSLNFSDFVSLLMGHYISSA